MSRERELLKRTLKYIVPKDDESLDYDLLLYSQIRDLLAEPEQEPDIDYIVKEIHKKCFHQSLNTAPVITVRNALSIFRKYLKGKRTP